MIENLITAIQFLTILPIRSRKKQAAADLGKAAGWFSYVGVLIGGLTAAAYYGAMFMFPKMLAAALTAVVWICLTGGLHLDGVADCCDGLFCSTDKNRRLEIMKDPHHGTFGSIGLTFVILLKVIGLYCLASDSLWLELIFAAALSRWLLLLAGRQPSARPDGLGASFSSGLRNRSFIFGILPVCMLAYFIGWQAVLIGLLVIAIAYCVLLFARTRLGGVTGDVFGLLVEISEVLILIGFCVKGSIG